MASNTTDTSKARRIFDEAKHVASKVAEQTTNVERTIAACANAVENKWKESSTVTKATLVGGTVAVVAPLAIIPTLGVVGFTSVGVAAGSTAASLQTATTAAGSIFALCQSAGATGIAAIPTYVGVSAAAGAAAGGLTAAISKKTSDTAGNVDDREDNTEHSRSRL